MSASDAEKAEYTEFLKSKFRQPLKRWAYWADLIPTVALNLRSEEESERSWAEDSLECIQQAFADPKVYGGALIDLSSEETYDTFVADVNNCISMLNSGESGDDIFEWSSAALQMAGTLASRYVVRIVPESIPEQA